MGKISSPLRISITTGDVDGIGFEVAAKALAALGPESNAQFILWRSPWAETRYLKEIGRRFRLVPVTDPVNAWTQEWNPGDIIDVVSELPPDLWVSQAALACMNGLCDGLVTGPLSKTGMSQKQFLGHTELLASVSKSRNLFMSFWGPKFSVVLATGHMPLKEVPAALTSKVLDEAIRHAVSLRESLPAKTRSKPIALVGLNPHAGEEGLIGDEEQRSFRKLVQKWSEKGVEGPLVPDAAFLPKMQDKYSVFVCPYHDQGLIPFKLVHGFQAGVHVTMGLPFVRTSVDHGTAKEIFGLDQAEFGSMREALTTAISLLQRGNTP